jgi:hypothetical protein
MSFTKAVDGYLPSRMVCERYSISPRTLIRWETDPDMGFPAALRINNRKLFAEADLAIWERARIAANEQGLSPSTRRAA